MSMKKIGGLFVLGLLACTFAFADDAAQCPTCFFNLCLARVSGACHCTLLRDKYGNIVGCANSDNTCTTYHNTKVCDVKGEQPHHSVRLLRTAEDICVSVGQKKTHKPAAKPATPELLAQYPWITSDTLSTILGTESGIKEMHDLVVYLQDYITKVDFSPHTTLQVGEKMDPDAVPAKPEDVHVARLSGVTLVLQTDGSYLMRFYVADGQGKETIYKNVDDMAKAGVKPLETVKLEATSYVHTVDTRTLVGKY